MNSYKYIYNTVSNSYSHLNWDNPSDSSAELTDTLEGRKKTRSQEDSWQIGNDRHSLGFVNGLNRF